MSLRTFSPIGKPLAIGPLEAQAETVNDTIWELCPRIDLSLPTAPRKGRSLGVCLVVLIVTAAAVYAWQWQKARPVPTSPAPVAASVVVRWPPGSRAVEARRGPSWRRIPHDSRKN